MDQTWLGKAEARGFEKGKAQGFEKGLRGGFKKGFEEGFKKGFEEGFKKGRSEGKAQGKAEVVDQLRRLVLGRIEKRFGSVPDPVQARVRTIASLGPLVKLLEKLPALQSPEDLLPRRNGKEQPKSAA
jgi:hypothetical protein